MRRQIRWWDFLTTVSFHKFTRWFQYVIPAGIYKGSNLTIDATRNQVILPAPLKYVMPSGRTIEEEAELQFSLPTVSQGTESNFTVIAYGLERASQRTSEIRYLIQEGVYTDDLLESINPATLGLSDESWEFLVLGWLRFDGSSWFVERAALSVLDAARAETRLICPFPHQIISGSMDLSVNPLYGPVYLNSSGETEFLVGVSRVVRSATIRVLGANNGQVRVTLQPTAYNYVQTFAVEETVLHSLEIEPFLGDNPTLANSAIQIKLTGPVSLVDIVSG